MSFFSDQRLAKINSGKRVLSFAVAFDENYAPHACAMLTSLAENAKSVAVYEIIIMDDNVKQKTREIFRQHFAHFPHVQLRWVDMGTAFSGMHESAHYSKGAYFRMALPEILPEHEKVVYLNVDTIVLSDVAELFETDVTGYSLAASYNGSAFARLEKGVVPLYHISNKRYYTEILGLTDAEIKTTFNSGVMVLNLAKMRADGVLALMKEEMQNRFVYMDQCLLNKVFKGNSHTSIPFEWNVENFMWVDDDILDKRMFADYLAARQHPKLVHYTDKPWVSKVWRRQAPMENYYWQFLKKTPWYQTIRDKFEKDNEANNEIQPRIPMQIPSFIKDFGKRIPFLKLIVSTVRKK